MDTVLRYDVDMSTKALQDMIGSTDIACWMGVDIGAEARDTQVADAE